MIQVPNKDHFSSKLTPNIIDEIISFSNKFFVTKDKK